VKHRDGEPGREPTVTRQAKIYLVASLAQLYALYQFLLLHLRDRIAFFLRLPVVNRPSNTSR